MMKLYGYIASQNNNIGYKIFQLDFDTGLLSKEDKNRTIYQFLRDGSICTICGKSAEETFYYVQREIEVKSDNENGWYMNLAFEADKAEYSRWRNICINLIDDGKKFFGQFAQVLAVDKELSSDYLIDSEKVNKILEEADCYKISEKDFIEKYQVLKSISGKKILSLFHMLQRDVDEWDGGIAFLVPAISYGYYRQHCQVGDLGEPKIMVMKSEWKILYEHGTFGKENVVLDQKRRGEAHRKYLAEKKELLSIEVIVTVGLVCGYIIYSRNKRKK